MDISFRTRKLQKACSTAETMDRTWGKPIAKKLRQRLAELNAAECLADIARLPAARCHELGGDLKGHLSVDLAHPYRLLFIPAHNPVPTKPDGGLDWNRVTAIEITNVRDTH